MLTIIVPVFNEKRFVRTILKKLINTKGLKKQIIVVDDGSSDGTDLILRKEFIRNRKIDKIIFHKINKGKGAAIKSAQKFVHVARARALERKREGKTISHKKNG